MHSYPLKKSANFTISKCQASGFIVWKVSPVLWSSAEWGRSLCFQFATGSWDHFAIEKVCSLDSPISIFLKQALDSITAFNQVEKSSVYPLVSRWFLGSSGFLGFSVLEIIISSTDRYFCWLNLQDFLVYFFKLSDFIILQQYIHCLSRKFLLALVFSLYVYVGNSLAFFSLQCLAVNFECRHDKDISVTS